ncbi:MAG: glycosyltransferase family 2 protein [Candidatus Omnitrophica bacterium]|nr:glycosyltransferase family 2 protein [Candidatus Omnitrophota bacterium]
MARPTVSVIIPAYNKARTIRAAVRSVLEQTFTDLEILVVDDGSTDETPVRIQGLSPRVRYFRQDRQGVSEARNRGIREAQGEIVAFLDGDDLWLPEKLQRQMGVLEQEPRVDAVQCSVYLVNDALEVLSARRCDPKQDALLDFLLFRNLPGFGSTLLARKRRIESCGGFGRDLVILEDWDLACRLSRDNALKSLPDFLVLYRQHAGNRSRQVEIHVEPGFRSLERLFSDPTLESSIRSREDRIWARFFAMLAGGYAQNRQWKETLYWGARAVGKSPQVLGYLAGLPVRWVDRFSMRNKRITLDESLSHLS